MDQHYESVTRFVSALTGACSETEDIVHQAFLLAFERLPSGRDFSGNPGNWLCGTARNLVFAWWRKQRKIPEDVARGLALAAKEHEHVLAELASNEFQEALNRCIEKLPAKDRGLPNERYRVGRRITEMAASLNVNVSSLRVRLHRIRRALRRCIESQLPGEIVQ